MRSWVSALLLVSAVLWGQAPTGQMTATVTGPSGAATGRLQPGSRSQGICEGDSRRLALKFHVLML